MRDFRLLVDAGKSKELGKLMLAQLLLIEGATTAAGF
jgi:hypothetical protein